MNVNKFIKKVNLKQSLDYNNCNIENDFVEYEEDSVLDFFYNINKINNKKMEKMKNEYR
ncbi:MAG: hypothetical protein ACRCZK_06950 [Oscillospiraceae bacterium]